MKRAILGILLFAACGCSSPALLTVNLGPPISYRSETGDRLVARYGQLSDGTLQFVKVTMPDGREYTLPHTVSASGVRYTDDREIIWWEHQGAVRLDVRRADGAWEKKYPELRQEQEHSARQDRP